MDPLKGWRRGLPRAVSESCCRFSRQVRRGMAVLAYLPGRRTETTNYLDPAGTVDSIYSVRRVFDRREHPLAAWLDSLRRGRHNADSAAVWDRH